MGAYGDNVCKYCHATYHDLDEHECDIGELKVELEWLRDSLTEVRALVRPIIQNAPEILKEAEKYSR